jgi:hypothetical protein
LQWFPAVIGDCKIDHILVALTFSGDRGLQIGNDRQERGDNYDVALTSSGYRGLQGHLPAQGGQLYLELH